MFHRERSKSFFVENEKEFEEEIIKKSNTEDLSPRRQRKLKKNLSLEDEDEFENLLYKTNYVMEKELPSIEEQMETEEKELYILIENLNNKYKKNHLNNLNSDIESDNTESSEFDLLSCNNNNNKENNFFTEDEINNIIIPNNVKNFSKTIKFMVIGKSYCGKTYFINKLTNNKNFDEKKYTKTENFEIKKFITEFNENRFQIELWDTCEKFINSILISTYYKIANGFLFIIDKNTSIEYINNQINQIKKFVSNPKIFFIYNNNNNKDSKININNNNKCFDKHLLTKNVHLYNINTIFEFSEFNLFIESFVEKKTLKNIFLNHNVYNRKNKFNYQKDFYNEEN